MSTSHCACTPSFCCAGCCCLACDTITLRGQWRLQWPSIFHSRAQPTDPRKNRRVPCTWITTNLCLSLKISRQDLINENEEIQFQFRLIWSISGPWAFADDERQCTGTEHEMLNGTCTWRTIRRRLVVIIVTRWRIMGGFYRNVKTIWRATRAGVFRCSIMAPPTGMAGEVK